MSSELAAAVPQLVVTSKRWLKWVVGFCMVTCLAMIGIWIGAYFEEGWSRTVVWSGVIFAFFVLLAVYISAATFQSFAFYPDRVEWRRVWQSISFPYPAISAVEHRDYLVIKTRRARYRVYFPMRDTMHQVQQALKMRVPALIAAHQHLQPLPIKWKPNRSARSTNIFFFLLLGPGFIAFGGAGLWNGFRSLGRGESWGDSIGGFVIGGLAIPLAFLMGWLFVTAIVWSVRFDNELIGVRYLFRTKSYPVALLEKMTVDHEIRTYRGVSRQAWYLLFNFSDGREFKFEPTENGVANGYAPEFDRQFLSDLRDTLAHHYFPADRDEVSTASIGQTSPYAEDKWGQPNEVKKETVDLYDFTLTTLDYGEQSMGAWRIHFVLTPPLGGLERIQTINGRAIFSPNQRYLVILMTTELTLFDLATGRVYRPHERREWFYHDASFNEQFLSIILRHRTDQNRREPLAPIPLDQLDETMVRQDQVKNKKVVPADPLTNLLNDLHSWPADKLAYEFETARDLLLALDITTTIQVLYEAQQPRQRPLFELLVTVLADRAYPPAMPHFVEWLTHPEEQIRFVAAMALDQFAGGRFAIEKMIVGGWIQHDQIAAAVPDIQSWWRESGRHSVPSEAEWLAKQETRRPVTEQEKRFNFVELNPDWVMQGDGIVQPPADGYTLPRNKGIHIVGGGVVLRGETVTRFTALEVDSHAEDVLGAHVRIDSTWVNVTHLVESLRQNVDF